VESKVGAKSTVRIADWGSARNTNFSATCKSNYIENAEEKACRVNRPTPRSGERIRVSFQKYNPKPEAQNRPEAGLFTGTKFGRDSLERN
jgi:hypothetical protein